MDIVTMNCANNQKVIINLNDLKNNENLEGAIIFKRLFNLDNSSTDEISIHFANQFKEEEINTNLFKIYNITQNNWYTFLNFIRNGRIKYDISSQYIENEDDRISYQKLLIQELDNQSNSGIFLSLGPFPKFDNYIKYCITKSINNILNRKTIKENNPMTPDEDVNIKYDWYIGAKPFTGVWSSTRKIEHSSYVYWRRLKQN